MAQMAQQGVELRSSRSVPAYLTGTGEGSPAQSTDGRPPQGKGSRRMADFLFSPCLAVNLKDDNWSN